MPARYINGIQLEEGKLDVWSGQVDFNNLPEKTGVVANIYIDSNGKLWKVT